MRTTGARSKSKNEEYPWWRWTLASLQRPVHQNFASSVAQVSLQHAVMSKEATSDVAQLVAKDIDNVGHTSVVILSNGAHWSRKVCPDSEGAVQDGQECPRTQGAGYQTTTQC